jgi:hypothetical protein
MGGNGLMFSIEAIMSTSTSKTWEQRMLPHLESLAAKMIRTRHFDYLRTVADLLVGLSGSGWSRLADEDKLRFVEKMRVDFHTRGMGDSEYGSDPDYAAVHELIELEFQAVKRRI